MDKNGYNESIMPSVGCYLCGRGGDLARHEVFGGTGRRSKSKEYGLWVTVCPRCHEQIHMHGDIARSLRAVAQSAAMQEYGWTTTDFITKFGGNYL